MQSCSARRQRAPLLRAVAGTSCARWPALRCLSMLRMGCLRVGSLRRSRRAVLASTCVIMLGMEAGRVVTTLSGGICLPLLTGYWLTFVLHLGGPSQCHRAMAFTIPLTLPCGSLACRGLVGAAALRRAAFVQFKRSYMKEPKRFVGIRNTATVDGAVPGLARNVWDQHKLRVKYPKLEENISADVCVVGAGVSGLSIAYNLVKAGKSVVVLESRARGSGQSGRTSAHLMLWNDDYYHFQEQNFNLDTAKVLAESQRQSIDWIAKTVEEEGIDCHFQYVDGYLFPHSAEPDSAEKLDKELGAAVRCGLTDVRKVNLENAPEAGLIGEALLFPRCANINPVKYAEGLADAITKHGGRIFENTRVRKFDNKEVKTRDGFVVTAPNVVLATNPPIHHNMTIHARLNPQRTYAVGLKMPEGGFKADSQFWSTATPYHNIRTENHPEHGEVMIVGGETHSSGLKPQEYTDRFQLLEAWARQRWPQAGERVYEWSAMVYNPWDQIGLYGQDPGNDLQLSGTYYCAAGHSGQVVTGGTIAGIIISNQILGNQHPWSDVYSPSRLPSASQNTLGQLYEVSRTTIQALSNVVVPGRFDNPEDLAPGCGAVQQAGKDKVAVYKDESGVEHTFSAVCPHVGCLVQWNPLDGTFDCPCHGSIFTKEGKCINGPAVEDLRPVKIGTFGVKSDDEAAVAQGGKTF